MNNILYSPDVAKKIREAEPIEAVALREAPAYLEAHKTSSGVSMKNPLNPKNNKNAATASNVKHCYSRWGGGVEAIGKDVIFMISDFRNCNYIEAYNYLRDYYGLPISENEHFTNWINKNKNRIDCWHKNLFKPENKKALDYLHSRKINDDTIRQLKIGYCEDGFYQGITIPYFDQSGQPIYFARRYFDSYTGATSKDNVAKYIKGKLFNSAIEEAKEKINRAQNGDNSITLDNKTLELGTKAKTSDYSENIIWGYHTLNTADRNKKDTLIIAEGAFDALTFSQEGYPTISGITCSFSGKQQEEVFKLCRRYDKVILTLDNDPSGQSGNHKLAKEFLERGINFYVAILPKRINYQSLVNSGLDENNPEDKEKLYYKDVSEYYEDYGEVEGLLNNPDNLKGIIYQSGLYSNSEYSFRKFVLSITRKVEKSDILELIEYARENYDFSEIFLDELKKYATSPPPEKLISDEVRREHDLIFKNKKYYEYQDNQWNNIQKERVQYYIGEKLGRFKSGRLINNITRVLTADIVSDVEFNEKRVLVFQDGTLELDSFSFRASRKEDYNTFKLDYPYKPEAEINCPVFDKFISDIAGGDKDKEAVLLEYGGYGFFPRNSMKKFLYLLGDGDNGKSIYLQLIADVFGGTGGVDGLGNVSKVGYEKFGDNFERIHLKGKMFNFSNEITRDTRGSEPILKAITGGDYITGAYKGIDSVSFRCDCKLIFTGNGLPITKDKVKAYFNRFIIVNLPIAFVPEPKGQYEKLADPDISNKMRAERPSIIKRFIEASKQLKKNGKFTDIKESNDLLEEYREISTPVLQFLNALIEDINLILTEDVRSDIFSIEYSYHHGGTEAPSYLDYSKLKDSDSLFVKSHDLFLTYNYFASVTGNMTKAEQPFSKDIKYLIEKIGLGEPVNRGVKGRGYKLYKTKLAELGGYSLDENYNYIDPELEQNIKKIEQEGFELIN